MARIDLIPKWVLTAYGHNLSKNDGLGVLLRSKNTASIRKKLVKLWNHSNMTSCFDEFFWPNFPEISQFPHDPWGWLPIGTVFYVRIRKNSLNYEIILIWRPILTTFFWRVNSNGDRRPEVAPGWCEIKKTRENDQGIISFRLLCNAQKKNHNRLYFRA